MAKRDESEDLRLFGLYEKLRERLLDLTNRNRMLNYKISERSKSQLRIVDEVLEGVYSQMVGDETPFRIVPLPEPDDIPADEKTEEFLSALAHGRVSDLEYVKATEKLDSDDPGDEAKFEKAEAVLRQAVRRQLALPARPSRKEINRAEHARLHHIDPSIELPVKAVKDTHRDKDLQTLKFSEDLDRTLDRIASGARLAEQEMGVSTLFLAFGFLERYESDDSDVKFLSPLLLLPVKLEKETKRGRETFSVSAREGAAEANLSLQKLVQRDFKREIPNFSNDDEGGIGSIEKYFDDVRHAIDGLKRWNIRRWLVLGHFAFGRFAMYADLEAANWKGLPTSNSLVSSILRGTDSSGGTEVISMGAPPDYEIDRPEIEREAPFLIQDADASQHSAIIDVMRGINLVIQGPPGTGKSQTITNIIANALAKGKKVLFLSEKQAALEVVKRRLETAGLGEFCLELHSDKSSPKAVIESLRQRLKLGVTGKAPQPYANAAWLGSRDAISNYVSDLHKLNASGSTAFGNIWKSIRFGSELRDLSKHLVGVKIPATVTENGQKTEIILSDLDVFASQAGEYLQKYQSPWNSIWRTTSVDQIDQTRLPELLNQVEDAYNLTGELDGILSITNDIGISSIADLQNIVAAHSVLPMTPPSRHLDILKVFEASEIQELATTALEASKLSEEMEKLPDVSGFSAKALDSLAALKTVNPSEELLTLSATDATSMARASVDKNTQILVTTKGMNAILSTFGLTPAASLNECKIAAEAIVQLSAISPKWLSWYNNSQLDEAMFEPILREWRQLRMDEEVWRARFPKTVGFSWPSAHELEQASKILSRSKVGKALTVLSLESRNASKTLRELGETTAAPDDIHDLTKHVAALIRFEGNASGAITLGKDWSGLNTPFEEIESELSNLRAIRSKLAKISSLKLDAKALRLIVSNSDSWIENQNSARDFVKAEEHLRTLPGTAKLSNILEDAQIELHNMQAFLAINVAQNLGSTPHCLGELLEAELRRGQHRAATKLLESSKPGLILSQLIRKPVDFMECQKAIDWLVAVRSLSLPEFINDELGSQTGASLIREKISATAQRGSKLLEQWNAIIESLSNEFGFGNFDKLDWLELKLKLNGLVAKRGEARDFIQLKAVENRLRKNGLAELFDKAISNGIPPESLTHAFAFLSAAHNTQNAIRKSEALKNSGIELASRRKQFIQRDREKIVADRSSLRSALCVSSPPRGWDEGPKKNWTDLALLRSELNKEKRFLPARTLLSRAGRAVQELMPCFMMSPLSLAKFAMPESLKFDLLVIDEASQMRSEDALGGLLRSNQVVVVGDQKQLPPTDFFGRAESNSDADDDEDVEDDESILENCRKTFGTGRRLSWHYRSKCESLIRFSNEYFYDKALITFPAPTKDSFSIDLVRVKGYCQSRRNPLEAAAITEEVVSFMLEHAGIAQGEVPTIGVVAINSEQRDLIQEEFSRLTAGNPKIESYLARAKQRNEEFFIKNLENVQGDERDYIFISMTYGPEPGIMVMKQRFGPINRKQGHRRLNVLFSRARVRIGLFCSFGSEDVKPTEKSSDGVHALRDYLKYVEARGISLGVASGREPDSDFEIEVARRLVAKGYFTEPQVGVSGYRIDFAVLDPERPGQYLAGVECDGAAYHSSKSARDRDRLREDVLGGLGWEIIRVWSTDWFDDPNRETERLLKRLAELRSRKQTAKPTFTIAERKVAIDDRPQLDTKFAIAGSFGQNKGSEAVDTIPNTKPTSFKKVHSGFGLPLLPFDARAELTNLRDIVIREEVPDWTIQRSILREAMIETFLSQKITNADDWFKKVPTYLRQATNPAEKNYLDQICLIVERSENDASRKS